MSDKATAWLRTIVPALWSTGLAWLLIHLPVLHSVAAPLGALGTAVAVPVVLAAYKALLAWLEPKLPAWVVRLLNGSARTPMYPKPKPPVTFATGGFIPAPPTA
jgi:hypothetical protein